MQGQESVLGWVVFAEVRLELAGPAEKTGLSQDKLLDNRLHTSTLAEIPFLGHSLASDPEEAEHIEHQASELDHKLVRLELATGKRSRSRSPFSSAGTCSLVP